MSYWQVLPYQLVLVSSSSLLGVRSLTLSLLTRSISVTLSYSSLPLELRDLLCELASSFGHMIRALIVTIVFAPRIQILALTSHAYLDFVDFTIGDRDYHQRLLAIGRLDQCLRSRHNSCSSLPRLPTLLTSAL